MRDYQPIDPPEKGVRRSPTKSKPRRRASAVEAGGPRNRLAPKVLTRIPSLATADPLNRRETAPSEGHRGWFHSSVSTRILAGGMAVLLGAAAVTAVYQLSRDKEGKTDESSQSAQISSPAPDVSPASAAGTPLWDKAKMEAPAWQPPTRPEESSDLLGQINGPSSTEPPAMSTTYHQSLEAGRARAPQFGGSQPRMTANRAMAIPEQNTAWLDYQDYAALAALQGPTLGTETVRAAAAARQQRVTPPGGRDPSAAYPPRYPSTGYPPAEVAPRGSAGWGPRADDPVSASDPGAARFEGTIQKPPMQTTYERTRSSLR